jgi:hypothetical protein
MPKELEPKEVVQKQLETMKAEHMHLLMVALGKSHPDLATIDQQDKLIQRIDRALSYLKHYPKGGYGLADEPASSPKVFQWMKRFFPTLTAKEE